MFPAEAFAADQLTPPDKINYPALKFSLPQAERVVLENGMVLFYLLEIMNCLWFQYQCSDENRNNV